MQRREQAGAAGAQDQNVGLQAFEHGSSLTPRGPGITSAASDATIRAAVATSFCNRPPWQVLDDQHADAAQHVDGQQEHETGFRKLYDRICRPLEEAVKPRFPVDGKPQRQEMQGQEAGESQAGQAVDHERPATGRSYDVGAYAWS
jgi:hypothetical protein